MKTDPRIDAYIDDKAADFAKPILRHLRALIHEACPECEETLKWSMPTFMYKGKILAGLAAFKAHATLGFWNESVLGEDEKDRSAMGQFGRIAALDDLPPRDTLIDLIRKSMALIDSGAKAGQKSSKAPFTVPQDLQAAIDGAPAAKATWDAFPPSCKREYVEWVTEAKRDETRTKRLNQTIEQLSEGKRRHWKYEKC
ncbi:MAG TPA: YdeI/OmpD-associated family protein [Allosphingosinicella sp.]|nr:YdeI/OmpD-associated family protein [Allosphingosinicella sp.]